MTPDELDDLAVADEGERMFKDIMGGLSRGSSLPPEPTAPVPVMDDYNRAAVARRKSGEAQKMRDDDTDSYLYQGFGSLLAGNGLGNAIGSLGDAFMAHPITAGATYAFQKGEKLLGGNSNPGWGDEEQILKTFAKPFSNVIPSLKSLDRYPGMPGKEGPQLIDEKDTLQGEQMKRFMQEGSVAFDPNATAGDRAAAGGMMGLRGAFALASGPKAFRGVPGFGDPIEGAKAIGKLPGMAARGAERLGVPNPTVGEAAGSLGRAIEGANRAMFPAGPRRGVIDFPGMSNDEAAAYELLRKNVARAAEAKKGRGTVDSEVLADRAMDMIDEDDALRASLLAVAKEDRAKAIQGVVKQAFNDIRKGSRSGNVEGATPFSDIQQEGMPAFESTIPGMAEKTDDWSVPLSEPEPLVTVGRFRGTPAESTANLAKAQALHDAGKHEEAAAILSREVHGPDAIDFNKATGGKATGKIEAVNEYADRYRQPDPGVPKDRKPSYEGTPDQADELATAAKGEELTNPRAAMSEEARAKDDLFRRTINPTAEDLARRAPVAQNATPPAKRFPITEADGSPTTPTVPAQSAESVSLPTGETPPTPPAPGVGGSPPLGMRPTRQVVPRAPASGGPWEGVNRPAPFQLQDPVPSRAVPPKLGPSLKGRTPVRADEIPQGPWEGVSRPGPPTPPPMNTPNPPRRAPVQKPQAEPPPYERNETGVRMNHVDALQNESVKHGNEAGVELAEQGRRIVNNGESRAAGPVAEVDAATERALANPEARAELEDIFVPKAWKKNGAGKLFAGKWQVAADSNAPKMLVSAEERLLKTKEANDLLAVHKKVMAETGKEAEDLGVVTANGNLFKARDGDIMVQKLDPSAYEWMKDNHPDFEEFKELLLKIWPYDEAIAIGNALKRMAAQPLDRPTAMEFERLIPMIPVAKISKDGSRVLPILRHNPLPMSTNTRSPIALTLESQWMRLAGIRELGQDVTAAIADGGKELKGVISEMPLGQALQAGAPAGESPVARSAEKMLAAIYRRPEAGYTGANPAGWQINTSRNLVAQLFRGVIGKTVSVANLSMQGIKSVTQSLVEVPSIIGWQNYAKGLAKTIFKHGEASEEAKLAGAVHQKFILAGSKVRDRHRVAESMINAGANRFPSEKINDMVKDFHDAVAFSGADLKAEQMLAKGPKRSDLLAMDEMNIPQDVQDVFRNPKNYDEAAKAKAVRDYGRSVTNHSQFHKQNPALKGYFENDPILRYVAPYLQYSINAFKRTMKDMERVWRTSGMVDKPSPNIFMRGIQRINPFGGEKEPFRNSLQRLVTRVVGAEVAGEVVADLSAKFQGKDWKRSDRTLLARFLENLSYVNLLGPAHFIFDMTAGRFLGDDTKEIQKKFEEGRVGSRAPGLHNPAAEAVGKAVTKLGKGDLAGAGWEVTGGVAPIIPSVGRATGLMAPSGKPPTVQRHRLSGMFDDGKGGKHKLSGMFDEKPKGQRHKLSGLFE